MRNLKMYSFNRKVEALEMRNLGHFGISHNLGQIGSVNRNLKIQRI